MGEATRGRQMLGLGPEGLLQAEAAAGLTGRFGQIDAVASALLRDALHGKRIASVTAKGNGSFPVLAVSSSVGQLLADEYAARTQQARGAWWLPDEAQLGAGLLNLPALILGGGRFPHGTASDDNRRFRLADPHALFLWAVLQGLFEALLAPIELRARPPKTPEDNRKAWAAVEASYAALGVDADALGPVQYGSGWGRLHLDEQRRAKQTVIAGLAEEVTDGTVQLWRAYRTGDLISRYYAKSKREPASHRQVVTKPLAPVVSGYFGGDWLRFLDYLGEQPSKGEQITTALPKPRLYVEGSEKVRDVAEAKGVPVEEVQRMLATFYGEASVQSPVERRVAVMRRYWAAFDEIHARQASGMRSLWGLVDDGFGFGLAAEGQPYNPGINRRLLPTDLVAEIDELWGTECLERWPDRIVSATHPHKLFADAFGLALSFWHGCALTAWFICEGPYSRTDLAGMEHYYRRDLDGLTEVGSPVDRALFADLIRAEQRLGPPVPIVTDVSEHEVAPGITLRTSMSSGNRREGFAVLRDIVTRHRRSWSSAYLDGYLRSCWEPRLQAVAWEHSRWLAVKGKGPTLKQFTNIALPSANAWFGGNLGDLFGALGEKPPATPERVSLMPPNRVALAALVFRALGGEPVASEDAWQDRERHDRQSAIRRLADEAPRYVQLQEAFGRPPEAKEIQAETWRWPDGIESIWPHYAEIIERSRVAAFELVDGALNFDLEAPPSSSPQIARPDFPGPNYERSPAPSPPIYDAQTERTPRRSIFRRQWGRS